MSEASENIVPDWLQSIVQSLGELAFIFAIAAIVPFWMVAAEYGRARKAGELDRIPKAAEGGLPTVLFFEDLLPKASKERLAFVMLIRAAIACAVAGILLKYLVH